MDRYKNINREIHAFQWDGGTVTGRFFEWADDAVKAGKIIVGNNWLHIAVVEGLVLQANKDDYIVKLEDGTIYPLSKNKFKKEYIKIK